MDLSIAHLNLIRWYYHVSAGKDAYAAAFRKWNIARSFTTYDDLELVRHRTRPCLKSPAALLSGLLFRPQNR
jgi:hypothetical protein